MSNMRRREDGQVLVLFALMLLVLVGMGALTLDYAYWLQEKRVLQNAADAAAQAGVSELAVRPITATKQTAAVQHSMGYLDDQLGMGLEANGQLECAASAALVGNGFGPEDCAGYNGPDRVHISTPVSSGCAGASWGNRAVSVRIVHRSTRFLSRIYSSGDPDVGVCATSAVEGGGYAISVLKPNTGTNPNNANLTMKLLGSDTSVRVWGGDVAVNAAFSGAGAPPPNSPIQPSYLKFMSADGTGISDNRLFATIDNPSPLSWSIPARQIRTEGPTTGEADDVYHEPRHLPAYVQIPGWGNSLYAALGDDTVVPLTMTSTTAANGTCTDPVDGAPGVAPGKYNLIEVGVRARRWLCPGVYHLVSKHGQEGLSLSANSTIAGQGVTLVVDNDSKIRIDSGGTLLLNSAGAGGTETDGPWRTGDARHDVAIAIWIEPVPGCDPRLPACGDSTSSEVFTMSGGAGMDIDGVIYGPTDKMSISGNNAHHGAGEIWAWTLTYAGNSKLDQVYEGNDVGYPLLVE